MDTFKIEKSANYLPHTSMSMPMSKPQLVGKRVTHEANIEAGASFVPNPGDGIRLQLTWSSCACLNIFFFTPVLSLVNNWLYSSMFVFLYGPFSSCIVIDCVRADLLLV